MAIAEKIGYPVVVRPSYVLGGRAMEIVYDAQALTRYMTTAVQARPRPPHPDRQVLGGRHRGGRGRGLRRPGLPGGRHHGAHRAGRGGTAATAPACCPHHLKPAMIDEIRRATHVLAFELGVLGLMNIQFAVKDDLLYLLEVNPGPPAAPCPLSARLPAYPGPRWRPRS